VLSRIYKEQGFQGDNYHSRISQESMEEVGGSNNHLNGLYPDNLGEPAPELTETLTQYIPPSLSSNSSWALPNFSLRPRSLPLGSNTNDNAGKQLKET